MQPHEPRDVIACIQLCNSVRERAHPQAGPNEIAMPKPRPNYPLYGNRARTTSSWFHLSRHRDIAFFSQREPRRNNLHTKLTYHSRYDGAIVTSSSHAWIRGSSKYQISREIFFDSRKVNRQSELSYYLYWNFWFPTNRDEFYIAKSQLYFYDKNIIWQCFDILL